jgi:methionyl-tRNA synthetase
MAKFYITTSIAYPNAKPHLGHALEAIQADVLARYHRHQGDEVYFVTGTDEHGQKMVKAAEAAGKTVETLTTEASNWFIDLYAKLGISNDDFIRTTEKRHQAAATKLWKASTKDDIYEASYTGLYCVGCEQFYTEKELIKGLCPIHKTKPEEVSETNYFFRLSRFSEIIKDLIASDNLKIYPEARKNEILAFIEEGLQDVSISRSTEHLKWGIPVPGDSKQVMYVWYDALSNYISAIGYGSDESNFDLWWPADLQLIGKDILRFHAVLWPAMLISAGLKPAKSLLVHGFITIEGEKMSKSLGNVVDPSEIVEKYGPDALRYYLLREIPAGQDGNFSQERFDVVYNSELANDLGNALQRTLAMITKYRAGVIGEVPATMHDVAVYHEAMLAHRFDRALEEIWSLIRGINQFIDAEKPWELAKTDQKQLDWVLGQVVADLRQVATLLLPFLPTTAGKIIQALADDKVNTTAGVLFPKHDLPTFTEHAL